MTYSGSPYGSASYGSTAGGERVETDSATYTTIGSDQGTADSLATVQLTASQPAVTTANETTNETSNTVGGSTLSVGNVSTDLSGETADTNESTQIRVLATGLTLDPLDSNLLTEAETAAVRSSGTGTAQTPSRTTRSSDVAESRLAQSELRTASGAGLSTDGSVQSDAQAHSTDEIGQAVGTDSASRAAVSAEQFVVADGETVTQSADSAALSESSSTPAASRAEILYLASAERTTLRTSVVSGTETGSATSTGNRAISGASSAASENRLILTQTGDQLVSQSTPASTVDTTQTFDPASESQSGATVQTASQETGSITNGEIRDALAQSSPSAGQTIAQEQAVSGASTTAPRASDEQTSTLTSSTLSLSSTQPTPATITQTVTIAVQISSSPTAATFTLSRAALQTDTADKSIETDAISTSLQADSRNVQIDAPLLTVGSASPQTAQCVTQSADKSASSGAIVQHEVANSSSTTQTPGSRSSRTVEAQTGQTLSTTVDNSTQSTPSTQSRVSQSIAQSEIADQPLVEAQTIITLATSTESGIESVPIRTGATVSVSIGEPKALIDVLDDAVVTDAGSTLNQSTTVTRSVDRSSRHSTSTAARVGLSATASVGKGAVYPSATSSRSISAASIAETDGSIYGAAATRFDTLDATQSIDGVTRQPVTSVIETTRDDSATADSALDTVSTIVPTETAERAVVDERATVSTSASAPDSSVQPSVPGVAISISSIDSVVDSVSETRAAQIGRLAESSTQSSATTATDDATSSATARSATLPTSTTTTSQGTTEGTRSAIDAQQFAVSGNTIQPLSLTESIDPAIRLTAAQQSPVSAESGQALESAEQRTVSNSALFDTCERIADSAGQSTATSALLQSNESAAVSEESSRVTAQTETRDSDENAVSQTIATLSTSVLPSGPSTGVFQSNESITVAGSVTQFVSHRLGAASFAVARTPGDRTAISSRSLFSDENTDTFELPGPVATNTAITTPVTRTSVLDIDSSGLVTPFVDESVSLSTAFTNGTIYRVDNSIVVITDDDVLFVTSSVARGSSAAVSDDSIGTVLTQDTERTVATGETETTVEADEQITTVEILNE